MIIFKKLFSLLSRLGISIILLLLLFKFKQIDTRLLWENIKHTYKIFLLPAFLFNSSIYILCFYRWAMLLEAAKIDLSFKRIFVSFSGGIFFNLFFPSTIGGDFARSLDLAAHTKRPREVVATVFLDRLSGYVGLVILVLFSLLAGWQLMRNNRLVLLSVAIIIAVLIMVLLFLFNHFFFSRLNRLLSWPGTGRIMESLKNLHQEIHHFGKQRKVLFNNIVLSVLIQAVSPLTTYLIALSLGIKLNIIYFLIFLPIIGAITLLPISIGGLGVRENMTVLFFSQVGIDQNLSLAMSLLGFSFTLIYSAVGGFIYVLGVRNRRV